MERPNGLPVRCRLVKRSKGLIWTRETFRYRLSLRHGKVDVAFLLRNLEHRPRLITMTLLTESIKNANNFLCRASIASSTANFYARYAESEKFVIQFLWQLKNSAAGAAVYRLLGQHLTWIIDEMEIELSLGLVVGWSERAGQGAVRETEKRFVTDRMVNEHSN